MTIDDFSWTDPLNVILRIMFDNLNKKTTATTQNVTNC